MITATIRNGLVVASNHFKIEFKPFSRKDKKIEIEPTQTASELFYKMQIESLKRGYKLYKFF